MRATLVATLFLGLILGRADAGPGDGFRLGFNQGWIDGKWGRDLTTAFDEADWRRVLRRTRECGGSVLRVWLFEEKTLEGVTWDFHRPTGVDPLLVENVRRVSGLAREERVQLYWTLLDGNWQEKWGRGLHFERRWNIFNDRHGYGDAFRAFVLAPVLDAIRDDRDVVYAIDLMNEVEGAVASWSFDGGWCGARRFLRTNARFVKARARTIPVTASAGWATAADDIVRGRFDGLGLDFYDLHVYTDDPALPRSAGLAADHARERCLEIVLGEFGQSSKRFAPAHQAAIVRGLVTHARRLGFAAALAWRLEDDTAGDRRFSFFECGAPKLAAREMARLAGALDAKR